MEINDLELSVRAVNLLKSHGIETMDQFLNLDHSTVMGWKNSGRRTWNEIRELQSHVKSNRRRASLLGKAAALIFQLNEMKSELGRAGYFIGTAPNGLLRLYRELKKEDFDT